MGLKDLKEHLIPTLPWAMQIVQDEIFRDLGVLQEHFQEHIGSNALLFQLI